MADHITSKLENIISGCGIGADDADWLRAAVQSPAEGDERNAFKAWETRFINETGYPGTDFESFQAGAAWARSHVQPKGTERVSPEQWQALIEAARTQGIAEGRQQARVERLSAAAQAPAPVAGPVCTRSHPHEDMSPACEALTEKARAANLVRRFELVADEFGGMFREYQGKAMPDDVYARFCRLRDERIPALRAELVEAITKTRPAPPAVQDGALIAPTPLTPRQLEVLEFLYGSGPLEGRWFGDDHRPKYWWRSILREAFAVAAAQPPVQGSQRRHSVDDLVQDETGEWQ